MNFKKLKSILRGSHVFMKHYGILKAAVTRVDYNISEVTPVAARVDSCDTGKFRLNLVTPSVDQQHVFGGIATAIRFFELLCKACNCDARIITVDAPVNPQRITVSEEYRIIDSAKDSDASKQLVAFSDRYQKTIPIRKKDLFITTGWWTAYTFKEIVKWQKTEFNQSILPMIYLIQDYEPGFYPWSSRYLMADSTYRMDIPVYAVMNSALLREFFEKEQYKFTKVWHFEPVLNQNLKEFLPKSNEIVEKKKQIIVYGRPGTARNAFEVIVAALRIWGEKTPDAHQWKVYSAGEAHQDIELGNGITLSSAGKLTLQEYAHMMKETYAGISLMVSPHPSYPPLEMSTFGIRTITNGYANKDMASFNDNIISLQSASPIDVADALSKVCESYSGQGEFQVECAYVREENAFGNVIEQLQMEIESIMRKNEEKEE